MKRAMLKKNYVSDTTVIKDFVSAKTCKNI